MSSAFASAKKSLLDALISLRSARFSKSESIRLLEILDDVRSEVIQRTSRAA